MIKGSYDRKAPIAPQTTLVVLLGASKWPRWPDLDSEAFANSAREVRNYFLDQKKFQLPEKNLLDLFGSNQSADDIDDAISQFFITRTTEMNDLGQAASDILIYFIGHAGFAEGSFDYYLAIGHTRKKHPELSGLPIVSLARMVKEDTRQLRRIIILDCCYAASAFNAFQTQGSGRSEKDTIVQTASAALRQTVEAFRGPNRDLRSSTNDYTDWAREGTSLLCSSSRSKPSLVGKEFTEFTGALLHVLNTGSSDEASKMSLSGVKDLVKTFLVASGSDAPMPEIHSPDQRDGEVAIIPFFPNPLFKAEDQAKQVHPAVDKRVYQIEKQVPLPEATHLSKKSSSLQPHTSRRRSSILIIFILLALMVLVIVAITRGNILFLVHPNPLVGKITEFSISTSDSKPVSITSGPDGNLWFTESGVNKIGHITPSGSVAEFSVLIATSSLTGITTGPDGNLWFTDGPGSKIGRITPNGSVTEFSTPTPGFPTLITSGPDGNLWFPENRGSKIGRITPSGSVTEFSTPTPTSSPIDITLGRDGNLWFTENNSSKIGRITPNGSITEYPIPTFNSFPSGITTGPDGNLWFTEEGNSKIGCITPKGNFVAEYLIPTSDAEAGRITTGPDGNLWFTEYNSNKIGRITPNGSITEYPLPIPKSFPSGITTGPDGNLWFTEYNSNKIGRITSGK